MADDTSQRIAALYDFSYWISASLNPNLGKSEPPANVKVVGLLAYADGVNWNPGTAAGLFVWNGSAWKEFYGTWNLTPTPPGTIEMYGGSSAPTGYLLCDGAAVSRTAYANLFAILSTTYGSGDGSTTFNLPDFRGVFPKGAGTTNRAAGVDASGNYYAATLGTYLQDKMQGHQHQGWNGNGNTGTSASYGTISTASYTPSGTYHNRPTTDGTNGTPRTGLTTEPQSVGVNFIIKT